MQDLFKSIALVAPAGVPVLITGESGTGKELVARAIHRHSGRRDGPFLPICLAALSPSLVERELFGHIKGSFTGAVQDRKGLLELANGGTVLLDEIGDIAPSLQVKLLRAIEHGEVTPVGDARPRSTDIRVIAATNRPLGSLMTAGEFREDLFFRLSVFQIHIPPLRERRDDIPVLAEHFLRQARLATVTDTRIADDVLSELRNRPWTGNVRELRNAIEHAAIVARGQPIRPEHFPAVSATRESTPASNHNGIQADLTVWARRAFRERSEADSTLYERFLETRRASAPASRARGVRGQPRRRGADSGNSPSDLEAKASQVRNRMMSTYVCGWLRPFPSEERACDRPIENVQEPTHEALTARRLDGEEPRDIRLLR